MWWRKPLFSVAIVSIYLCVYLALAFFRVDERVIVLMWALSPLLIIWMVYATLRTAKYNGSHLHADEEWGYQDKNKEDLGVF